MSNHNRIAPDGHAPAPPFRINGPSTLWDARLQHLLENSPAQWAYWDHPTYFQISKIVARWNRDHPDTPAEGTCRRTGEGHRIYIRVTPPGWTRVPEDQAATLLRRLSAGVQASTPDAPPEPATPDPKPAYLTPGFPCRYPPCKKTFASSALRSAHHIARHSDAPEPA